LTAIETKLMCFFTDGSKYICTYDRFKSWNWQYVTEVAAYTSTQDGSQFEPLHVAFQGLLKVKLLQKNVCVIWTEVLITIFGDFHQFSTNK
jgi:hypothetical protein